MPMSEAQQRDLADLRVAAQARDLEGAQYRLKRLLQGMDYYRAIALVVERLYNFLDLFESYYPDEQWPRQMLLGVASFGAAPDDTVVTIALEKSFTEPGAGNFIKALYDLAQAMQARHTAEARIGFMVSAVMNAITAEAAEAWYGDRPDAWQTVRQQPPDDPAAVQIARGFWTDPQTAAIDTANWLAVADAVERALGR